MPTFRYCSKADFGQALRERFRTASGERAVKIIQWLLQQSDADLKTWFGLTTAQLTAWKTRCNNKLAAWAQIVGE